MPDRTRLATFVHVSDLHLGIPEADSGDAPVKSKWATCRWFDGLLGHSFLSLLALEAFFEDLSEKEGARLVVTGDLTQSGSANEFDVAAEFLGAVHQFPNGDDVGLEDASWADLAVPGNHDHWPGGGRILGDPCVAFHRQFGKHANYICHIPLPKGYVVTFLKVDTDADVHPRRSSRLLARGNFVTEIDKIDKYLGMHRRGAKEFRVLLMHHSLTHRGLTLAADDHSKDAARDLLIRHGIKLVLNGHTHTPLISPVSRFLAGLTGEATEVTCGTTTQRWTAPASWKRPVDRKQRNWLMVHRLFETGGVGEWEVTPAIEKVEGFEEQIGRRKTVPAA
jgi:3',5'-cyclic AMP phosphodiesterase CpdA